MTTVSEVATSVEDVIRTVSPYESMIAGILGMVPGLSLPVAAIQPFMPAIMAFTIRGLDDISKGNGGDLGGAVIEMMQHLSKSHPNSPILSGGDTGSFGGVLPGIPPAGAGGNTNPNP